jgi:protocatechuate 3,4-dioxygenase beta subunit
MHRRNVLRLGALTASALAAPAAGAIKSAPALTPEAEEGPFWFDPELLRADITEGRPGVPLGLRLTVEDGAGRPVPGALVEVWHCDAQGQYSGFDGGPGLAARDTAAGRYLRGGQRADRFGQLGFKTLYPGWYAGRAPHIHLKVSVAADTVLTSQLFLPDALSEFIYANVAAYRRSRLRDTLNSQDRVALTLKGRTAVEVREQPDRYLASATLVIDRAARSHDHGPPGGLPDRGAPPPPPGGFRGPPPGGPGFGRQALEGAARIRGLIPGVADG